MASKAAVLSISGPAGGPHWSLELRRDRVSVGRSAPGCTPDIALQPDPEQWVSRLHCFFEREGGSWWVTDNGTQNGTFVRRGGELVRVRGRTHLQDGDIVCVLGDFDRGMPRYWELLFTDPFSTRRAFEPKEPERACLEYDFVEARLYRRVRGRRDLVVPLGAKGHRLIRYMAECSRLNGGAPVACSHEELIRAVWGDPGEWPRGRAYTKENLRDLVSDVRHTIEPDPYGPQVLETVTGHGYRLVTCPGVGD